MKASEFERRYRRDGDPWHYRCSEYERVKYDATLSACGPGPFESALELGGSIGVFSARLAERCETLTTIDFSPTAVAAAREQLAGLPHARAIVGEIPGAIEPDRHDLVVASEILYYLDDDALQETLERLRELLIAGGRMVAVHWRPPGPERPQTAADVHARLRALPWLRAISDRSTPDYLLDVLERP
jgi:cyclopropane fatty-acyl-phospholipid synthase-like methyltransferase